MIRLENVSKSYRQNRTTKVILDRVSFEIPRGTSFGVLGVNGAGKSTFLRLLSGSEFPDSGRIYRENINISWPLGFAGSFHGSLTGRQNLKFACRIYGKDIDTVTAYVEEFAELGNQIDMPVKTYSSGMKARLAFGLSMAFNFDVYLVDEITAVGDARFKAKSSEAFSEKLSQSDIIMVSHSMETLRKFCQAGCVLANGQISMFANIDDAIVRYNELTKVA